MINVVKMKNLQSVYQLSNGVKIPCVGFGTWQAQNGDVAYTAVREALARGYRHIDTAAAYGNEESVGRAVRDSGLPREEIFVIPIRDMNPPWPLSNRPWSGWVWNIWISI